MDADERLVDAALPDYPFTGVLGEMSRLLEELAETVNDLQDDHPVWGPLLAVALSLANTQLKSAVHTATRIDALYPPAGQEN